MARSPSHTSEVVAPVAAPCHRAPQEIVAGGERDTPMRQSGERVHGPYRHYNRWRLVVDKGGEREKLTFASEREALQRKEELLKEIAGRTVSDAVKARIAFLRDQGLRQSSLDRAEKHLRR